MPNAVNRFLIEHNRQQSELFCSSNETGRRKVYAARHPTPVTVRKCMDGRVNVPVMTDDEVPMGVISPFRTMGGRFKIGSPNFAHFVRNYYEYVLRLQTDERNRCSGGLDVVTYHYSAGARHRGCRGFNYDTDAARAFTSALTSDFSDVYGSRHEIIHPVQMGVETDFGSFVFIGDDQSAVLDIKREVELTAEALRKRMRELYPDMQPGVFNDLMPFALGNQRHVRKVLEKDERPVELDHTEQIIGAGRGFDWLHLINRALIVGPFSVDWLDEVVAAAKIVLSNFKEGRIPPREGAVLLVSAPYREYGVDARVARHKAIAMAQLCWAAIEERVRELLEYDLELVVGTLDRNTMRLERIEIQPEELQHAA